MYIGDTHAPLNPYRYPVNLFIYFFFAFPRSPRPIDAVLYSVYNENKCFFHNNNNNNNTILMKGTPGLRRGGAGV